MKTAKVNGKKEARWLFPSHQHAHTVRLVDLYRHRHIERFQIRPEKNNLLPLDLQTIFYIRINRIKNIPKIFTMRFSTSIEYAICGLIYLVRITAGKTAFISDVAQATRVPEAYLRKVFQQKRANTFGSMNNDLEKLKDIAHHLVEA